MADKPQNLNLKLTSYVRFCFTTACLAGLLYGYNIGISGGVTVMDDFLIKFFPNVHERKLDHATGNKLYCNYDDVCLQFFTSSLFLSALIASFVAPFALKKYGHKTIILLAAAFFIVGATICSTAVNLIMLIIGRIVSGLGAGFGNVTLIIIELEHDVLQAVPLFLFEVLPVQRRSSKLQYPFGWRVSLGITGIPALVLLFAGFFITDTPASLIEHGKEPAASQALKKIRGVDDVDAEFNQLKIASEIAKQAKNPYKNLLMKTNSSPLIISVVLQIYQQLLIGINAIMFYAPILFKTVGFSLSAVIIGLVIVLGTLISIYVADKEVRSRRLLTASSVVMSICLMTVAVLFIGGLKPTQAEMMLCFMGVFVMVFACSWGPLGWQYPIGTFSQDARAAGFASAVSSTMFCMFLTAQFPWEFLGGSMYVPETKNFTIDAIVGRVCNEPQYASAHKKCSSKLQKDKTEIN
ncbi:hypothetical protein ACFE04_005755 [Oxalis oulophora]